MIKLKEMISWLIGRLQRQLFSNRMDREITDVNYLLSMVNVEVVPVFETGVYKLSVERRPQLI